MPGSFEAISNQQKQLLEQAQRISYHQPEEGGSGLNLHFYLPKGLKEGPPRPVFLFFFSSHWDKGNIIQFAPQALYFVDRGAVCGLVEYRTAASHPGSTPMMAMKDGLAAIRFVRLYHDQLNIDPEKLVVFGGGAGANIAGCAALGIRIKDPAVKHPEISPLPNAAVLLSALVDINRKSHAFKQFGNKSSEARKLSLSPLIDASPPCPLIMIHGTSDRITPLADAESFAAKMTRRKREKFEFHAFEGRDASFYNLNMDPVSFEASLNLIDRFLVEHLILEMNADPNGASLVSWREGDY